MTDNSHALKRARRQDSQAKRRKAAEILQAMIDAGEPVTFPAVARRAGVSVSLLYADSELAGRLSKARSRQRDAGADRAWRLPARSLVSEGVLADRIEHAGGVPVPEVPAPTAQEPVEFLHDPFVGHQQPFAVRDLPDPVAGMLRRLARWPAGKETDPAGLDRAPGTHHRW